MTDELETMLAAYLECALWSSTDGNSDDLDETYSLDDLSPLARALAHRTVRTFLEANRADIETYHPNPDRNDRWAQAGHDLWLTRNGHGSGYWDIYRATDEQLAAAQRLTTAARALGESDLYVSDTDTLELSR